MNKVEEYILDLPAPQRNIMQHLHELLLSYPEVSCKIRYKIPFYDRNSWVCYLNPIKNNGVELAFIHANELSNEQGLLDFKDRKQVAGMSLYKLDDIPTLEVHEILQEAFLVDEELHKK
jgi:hypothetical protein